MDYWSELPYDLIGLIAQHVNQVVDFIAFSCVCVSWRANAVKQNWLPGRQLPWVMLSESSDDNDNNVRGFYDLYQKKRRNLKLPQVRGRHCWGSIDGWICTAGSDDQISLLNPLTRAQISLPPQSTFDHNLPQLDVDDDDDDEDLEELYGYFIMKLKPYKDSTNGFLVLAFFSAPCYYLGFARPGDKAWTTVAGSKDHLKDAIYLGNGQIFAVNHFCDIYVCDLNESESPKATLFASRPKDMDRNYIYPVMHLVDWMGDLLLVIRLIHKVDDAPDETSWFAVYKLDFNTKEWIDVDDFGDYSIFVGCNSSMSVLASEVAGCKPNSIYFMDSRPWNGVQAEDMGVYNMSDETFTSFCEGGDVLPAYSTLFFWMMPTLY